MPALRGFFAQDDWGFLARGAGIVPVSGWIARPLSSSIYWNATFPLFGVEAPPYHAVSLLLAALSAVLGARIAAKLGLRTLGAGVAGLVVATTPLVVTAIFWISATGELLALCFGLAAIELWLHGGRRAIAGALLCAALSFASKEAMLGLPIWIALFARLQGRRMRGVELAVILAMAALALIAGWTTFTKIPHGPQSPYALGGADTLLLNLGSFGGWLMNPWKLSAYHEIGVRLLGWIFWAVWVWQAVLGLRRGNRVAALGLSFALLSLAPVLLLRTHLYPYYLSAAVVGLSWWLGSVADAVELRFIAGAGPRTRAALLVTMATIVGALAFLSTDARLTRRGEDGRLADPIAHRSATAAEAARTIRQLPLAAGGELAVLQATTMPETLLPPGDFAQDLLIGSPLVGALSGRLGLELLTPPGVSVSWAGHLDDVGLDAMVLLDAGGDVFASLGPIENARIYSALIAIAAGQHARGRHDLWSVIAPQGSQVRFAYESESLPIDPKDLTREARGFVEFLLEEATPANGRILKLFEQLYEAVVGEKLLRAPWGEMPKG
jgi:hypothetical protein